MENKNMGALWSKTSDKGKKYMSGIIEIDGVKHQVVVFKNDHKTADNHPDYKIYPSKKRGQKEADNDGTETF